MREIEGGGGKSMLREGATDEKPDKGAWLGGKM